MFSFLRRLAKSHSESKKRSVVFFRNSYYHYYYLARALRKRGWDAISVNPEDPNSPNANYYHGEDINIFSPDPKKNQRNLQSFFKNALKRFALFHFSEDGYLTFFRENAMLSDPPDIVQWKKLGKKVAYTVSGCRSAISQTSFRNWSLLNGQEACKKCIFQFDKNVCDDKKNLLWGQQLEKYCDLICAETLPALDYLLLKDRVFREPLTMCLDSEIWKPNLPIPSKFKQDHKTNEIYIYHAVGNYDQRTFKDGNNFKGTKSILSAIEQLKSEGLKVNLMFVTSMHSKDIRYIQSQADIIVDQLNMGRYGATSREGMMLGKPVITYINPKEIDNQYSLKSINEVPLISATEETIYYVLKDLILDFDKRKKIGDLSRAYALRWHCAEACAKRYELVYDAIMSGRSLRLLDIDKH